MERSARQRVNEDRGNISLPSQYQEVPSQPGELDRGERLEAQFFRKRSMKDGSVCRVMIPPTRDDFSPYKLALIITLVYRRFIRNKIKKITVRYYFSTIISWTSIPFSFMWEFHSSQRHFGLFCRPSF